MADGAEPGTTTDASTTEPGGTDAAPRTFTQDQVNDLLAKEKGKYQAKYADYTELKTAAQRLQELENASKTDLEKVAGERDELKQQLTPLQQENLRLKVALKKGLVGDNAGLAERLRGDTEEEMLADADELLKLVGAAVVDPSTFDGGARRTAPTTDMDSLIRQAAGFGN